MSGELPGYTVHRTFDPDSAKALGRPDVWVTKCRSLDEAVSIAEHSRRTNYNGKPLFTTIEIKDPGGKPVRPR